MSGHFKVNSLILVSLCLSGCGFSTFTQRETDPFIRDIVGNADKPIAIMVTDSSRRLIYEFKHPKPTQAGQRIVCADAPPDTSIAASGAVGGEVSATMHGGAPSADGSGSIDARRMISASTMPLVRRSQGLQYGRDLESKECILFATGITSREEYLARIDKIRQYSFTLINSEIKHGIGQLGFATTPVATLDPATTSDPTTPKQ